MAPTLEAPLSESGFGICITGATTLLGKELLGSLGAAAIDLRKLHAVDALNVETTQVEFRGKTQTVGLLNAEVLEEVDLVFVAGEPDDAGRVLLDDAADAGCLVLDLVGYRRDPSLPMLFGRNPGALEALRETGIALCPDAMTLALVALGAALRPLGLQQLRGTCMMSASVAGEAGVRELSGQVGALFNSQTPPRKVFEHGLAFDLLPGRGEALESGWMPQELLAAAQAAHVLGLPAGGVAIDEVIVPVFVGMGLSLQAYGPGLNVEVVRQAVDQTDLIERHREIHAGAMPRGMSGESTLALSRLRPDPAGSGVHCFLSADPMRLAASNAVQALLGLVELDLL